MNALADDKMDYMSAYVYRAFQWESVGVVESAKIVILE